MKQKIEVTKDHRTSSETIKWIILGLVGMVVISCLPAAFVYIWHRSMSRSDVIQQQISALEMYVCDELSTARLERSSQLQDIEDTEQLLLVTGALASQMMEASRGPDWAEKHQRLRRKLRGQD